ncbi:hypothetical protein GC175_31960 [bacterium]|nr:hypothetical protein [bacterium]
MSLRKLLMMMVTLLLIGAVFVGMVSALETEQKPTVATLQNVRDFAPAYEIDGVNYAIDAGELFAGIPGAWRSVATPEGVIVNAVAVSRQDGTLYIGAANELVIYRSADNGESWVRIPLDTNAIGGVTDIAVDGSNRLVFVGTDTDGLHRLRDVGASMIEGGQLVLDEPVLEVIAASDGSGMALVRTMWNLYRAEDFGLRWVAVENLPSPATAVAIAETNPATVYVGTASSGMRMSQDGINWQAVNNGLNYAPGSQLFIDDVAVDAAQPQVVYVSSSLSVGGTSLHTTPLGVSMSTDSAQIWQPLERVENVAVTDLMPLSGRTGAVYALTEASRTPLALGEAQAIELASVNVQPVEGVEAPLAPVVAAEEGVDILSILAWVLAGLAAVGLLAILWLDLARRRSAQPETGVLAAQLIRNGKDA